MSFMPSSVGEGFIADGWAAHLQGFSTAVLTMGQQGRRRSPRCPPLSHSNQDLATATDYGQPPSPHATSASKAVTPRTCRRWLDRLLPLGEAQPTEGASMEWIIAWLALAIGAGAIASSKGRSGFGYFVLGLFLPLIGLLIAIGMAPAQPAAQSTMVRHRAPHEGEKKCPACAEWILRDAKKCKHCGELLPDPTAADRAEWKKADAANPNLPRPYEPRSAAGYIPWIVLGALGIVAYAALTK
jgi:hypothetical protein